MSHSKKDFFYNPSFRASVYMFAWVFLACFKVISLLNPKWKNIIHRYEEGSTTAPATIGFASGAIFATGLFLFTFKDINWNPGTALALPMVYLLMGLMGWLSLVKFRDYEREKHLKNR